jgi:2-iminobutanoate/2-iminopropanoate deaminase
LVLIEIWREYKMEKIAIHTARAPQPGGRFSQAVRFGQLVFVAGTLGIDPSTGELVAGGTKSQVRQALTNISAILAEAGTSLENLLSVKCYLRDMADYEAYNEVYAEFFRMEVPPARTTLGVGSFVGDIAVEIEALAYVPE